MQFTNESPIRAWPPHKCICPEADWTQLNDLIHIPWNLFYETMFSIFVKHRTLTFPCSAGATSVADWAASLFSPPFPSFFWHQPLVRLATGTDWQQSARSGPLEGKISSHWVSGGPPLSIFKMSCYKIINKSLFLCVRNVNIEIFQNARMAYKSPTSRIKYRLNTWSIMY